jgi:hypothetical protein
MLTVDTLIHIILEFHELEDLGCTFDFKERFSVALATLEILGLTNRIKTKIPDCSSHCDKTNDCQWIPIYQKRKSRSKYRLTKAGKNLAAILSQYNTDKVKQRDAIYNSISNIAIVDIINSLLLDNTALTTEILISEILNQSRLQLWTLRITLQDILTLLESLEIIQRKEGLIYAYGQRINIKYS